MEERKDSVPTRRVHGTHWGARTHPSGPVTRNVVCKMMKVDDQTFNEALGVFQEFGPRRAIPRDERLHACFQTLSAEQIAELIAQFKAIEAFAYSVAEQVRDKMIEPSERKAQIANEFPVLDADRLSHTFSQAMYFSIK